MEDKKTSKYDLRIGNMFKEGVVCKINGRTGAKVHVYGRARYDSKGHRIKVIDSVSPENLTPIELTPEVLVDWCGFKGVNDKYYNNFLFDNSNSIKFDKDDDCWWYSLDESDASCYRVCKLDYLHELQNLYYVLNKKELEIKE